VRCSPFLFSKGDFVDVALELDVATGDKHGKTRVHLNLTHVVLLKNAIEISPVGPLVLYPPNPSFHAKILAYALNHQNSVPDGN
jgi:hypothetical protein